jgi:hypothetical protein
VVYKSTGGFMKKMWNTFVRGLADIPNEVYHSISGILKDIHGWDCLLLPFYFITTILDGSTYILNHKRVGTFAPRITLQNLISRGNGVKPALWSAAIGIVFGSIHCTAWQFQFPSYTEQLLWCISALFVTGGPLLVLLLLFVPGASFRSQSFLVLLSFVLVPLMLILYVSARLMLLVLSFMTLRSLSPGAFHIIDWTCFIPHV